MRIAVVVSYYNRPDLLRLCLHSLSLQTRKPDELIICDDGSETGPFYNGVDIYLRQPHNGFGKERLVNKALLETKSDYIIVADQDLIFPPNWLETHARIAKIGQFVCSMYTSLKQHESCLVTKQMISDGSIWQAFSRAYEGEPFIWCGAGSAVWRHDAIRINGFDTRFGVTGPDFNFGLRLAKLGRTWDHFCKYGRYLHMWHEKPWCADKTDYRSGDKRTANEYARKWAEEGAVTPFGIWEQNMGGIEVRRNGRGAYR